MSFFAKIRNRPKIYAGIPENSKFLKGLYPLQANRSEKIDIKKGVLHKYPLVFVGNAALVHF